MSLDKLPKELQELAKNENLDHIALSVVYKNWRGETSERTFIPIDLFYGSNEYHPEKQWLIKGYDLDKKEYRTYALRDIQEWKRVP